MQGVSGGMAKVDRCANPECQRRSTASALPPTVASPDFIGAIQLLPLAGALLTTPLLGLSQICQGKRGVDAHPRRYLERLLAS